MAEYKIDIEKSAQNILDRIQQKFGISAEQLLELAQAYQEGRCVVLPCKCGDTVWRCGQMIDWKSVEKEEP